ncbi:MAG: Signal peptidase I [Parcubacteria group bacterium GW2011_GWC1_41_7]|nr:MAG: Signal peptidase I [Parcubacteria group bacterium GW2011_GWC1_41_7]
MGKLKILQFIETVLLVLLIVIPIRFFLFEPFFVIGDSMHPTYENYDYLIIEKVSYKVRQPERGEVIILHPPVNPKIYYIKRIIGLPGETVKIKDGKVSVFNSQYKDGFIISETKYLRDAYTPGNLTLTLAPQEYFVLGDNRQASYDSRKWGPVSFPAIEGRVLVRVLPLKSFVEFMNIGFANR